MTRKSLIIILIILGGLFFFYEMARKFAPGSYAFAEHYELNYPEDRVIETINKLKISDTNLKVPKVSIRGSGQWDLNDGRQSETDIWYKFYFYDKSNNQILFTWTRPSGRNKTTFAFVSINNGLDIGHWKDINNDLGFSENREVKKNFEKTILKSIKENLNSN